MNEPRPTEIAAIAGVNHPRYTVVERGRPLASIFPHPPWFPAWISDGTTAPDDPTRSPRRWGDLPGLGSRCSPHREPRGRGWFWRRGVATAPTPAPNDTRLSPMEEAWNFRSRGRAEVGFEFRRLSRRLRRGTCTETVVEMEITACRAGRCHRSSRVVRHERPTTARH